MEKNLDIDRIVVKIAFMKNHNDGNVNAKIYFMIAITMFIIVILISNNIVLSFFSRFKYFLYKFFTIFCLI